MKDSCVDWRQTIYCLTFRKHKGMYSNKFLDMVKQHIKDCPFGLFDRASSYILYICSISFFEWRGHEEIPTPLSHRAEPLQGMTVTLHIGVEKQEFCPL
jgi:hypothetical protein